MGVSQEYIDQQRYYADAVQAYKANGMNHNAAWKKAEADWAAGQRKVVQNADTVGYKPQNADIKASQGVVPASQRNKDGTPINTASSGSNSSGNSTEAVRYRGSTSQTRVGTDTRVRGGTEASKAGQGMGNTDQGIAAAMKSATGKQFADSSDVQPVASKQNAWQGNRTPVNLASVQQRVLKSIGQ